MNEVKHLEDYIRQEPAIVLYVLNAAALLVSAFLIHVTKTQEAAIATISAALAAIIVGVLARPVRVPVLVGAVTAGLTAAAAFGLHLGVEQFAAIATVGTIVLQLLFRVHLTPTVNMPARAPHDPGANRHVA